MSKRAGTLYVIAAPSGAGKTSLVRELIRRIDDLLVSVSYTTRPARPGEIDGHHYHFIDQARFDQLVAEKVFYEYAEVYGACYGTSREWVQQTLAQGKDIILEIDWQGARQVATQHSGTVSIFILPPSLPILRERLEKRQQDSSKIVDQRMAEAQSDISHFKEFDYLVVNDNFEQALVDLSNIIYAQRLTLAKQLLAQAKLLDALVKVE